MHTALVIVDDVTLAVSVCEALHGGGFAIVRCEPTRESIEASLAESADIVVLSMFLREQSGFALCLTLRREIGADEIPILVLANTMSEMDRIIAFESGADDVLAIPFYPRELALRAHALIRRAHRDHEPARGSTACMTYGALVVDPARQEVRVGNVPVALTAKELAILVMLLDRPGRVFSRQEILTGAWNAWETPTARVVDTHVKSLRRKLAPAAIEIETVRGVGYRICTDSAPGRASTALRSL